MIITKNRIVQRMKPRAIWDLSRLMDCMFCLSSLIYLMLFMDLIIIPRLVYALYGRWKYCFYATDKLNTPTTLHRRQHVTWCLSSNLILLFSVIIFVLVLFCWFIFDSIKHRDCVNISTPKNTRVRTGNKLVSTE